MQCQGVCQKETFHLTYLHLAAGALDTVGTDSKLVKVHLDM